MKKLLSILYFLPVAALAKGGGKTTQPVAIDDLSDEAPVGFTIPWPEIIFATVLIVLFTLLAVVLLRAKKKKILTNNK